MSISVGGDVFQQVLIHLWWISPLCVLGMIAGLLAGLLGIGGGVVLVPGLVMVFHWLGMPDEMIMHLAVGTSLAIIVPTGLSSALSHWRKGAIDWTAFKNIAPALFVGPACGVALAHILSGEQLGLIFAIVIIGLAILMQKDPKKWAVSTSLKQPYASVAGFSFGALSSLVGIGGATLNVPYMSLAGVPIHRAIGTASALGILIALPGMAGFAYIGMADQVKIEGALGYIYGPAWLAVVVFSTLCAPLGARLSHAMPVEHMRKIFSIFMIIVAAKMIWNFIG